MPTCPTNLIYKWENTALVSSGYSTSAQISFSGLVVDADDAWSLEGGYLVVSSATVSGDQATFAIRTSNLRPDQNSVLATFSTSAGQTVRVVWNAASGAWELM